MTLVANARMYGATPEAAAAWRALFAEVSAKSGVALETVEHAAPAPLAALWSRRDLGCAFMCGFPFAHAAVQPQIVAAPLRAEGPVYRTELVVRAEAPFATLEATFGRRIGWTLEDSHSGWNAIRDLLPRYGERVGPLVTPRGVAEAVLEGQIDVGPLDGYVLALWRRYAPALAGRLRTVATTRPAPIPPIVASPEVPREIVARLGAAFLGTGPRPELLIDGFAVPSPRDYDVLRQWTS
jgi:ABC-type phosphate/phosphonate transport system substrate-binding protein